VVAVLIGERASDGDDIAHRRLTDPIRHLAPGPLGLGKPAPPEASEMVRDSALGERELVDELRDSVRPFEKVLEDLKRDGLL